uniref:Uncharacterized protein n=1 Tax=Lotharella globosa TaxID=91324 RepID=A0A7S3YBL0_9EUKA
MHMHTCKHMWRVRLVISRSNTGMLAECLDDIFVVAVVVFVVAHKGQATSDRFGYKLSFLLGLSRITSWIIRSMFIQALESTSKCRTISAVPAPAPAPSALNYRTH